MKNCPVLLRYELKNYLLYTAWQCDICVDPASPIRLHISVLVKLTRQVSLPHDVMMTDDNKSSRLAVWRCIIEDCSPDERASQGKLFGPRYSQVIKRVPTGLRVTCAAGVRRLLHCSRSRAGRRCSRCVSGRAPAGWNNCWTQLLLLLLQEMMYLTYTAAPRDS